MRLASVARWLGILTVFSTFGTGAGIGQSAGTTTLLSRASTPSPVSNSAPAVTPHANDFMEPEFVGLYRADGKFKKVSGNSSLNLQVPLRAGLRPPEVPASINLHPLEYVVEDYQSPAHAVKIMHAHSLFANLRDGLITFAYGRENSLQAPTHVTTDSRQRLIITDPELQAVHVLDVTGKSSFRIAGGPQHRLQMPTGIAVDAEDNIYVADGKRGVVIVYDPQGRFLRYLGSYRGESMFQSPSGIAIDRNAGYLYVLDSPLNEVVVLDLQGRIIKRVGGRRAQTASIKFDYPSEIAVGKDRVAILDSYGSRMQVFDLQCNYLNEFSLRNPKGQPVVAEIGLAIDNAANIYVSNLDGSNVKVYRQDGRLIGVLGRYGLRTQEFNAPSGVWIDSTGRMFVADTRNSRVLVFQVAEEGQVPKDVTKN